MGYIGQPSPDNKTLFIGTITTVSIGSALDMTGYDTALIQVNQTTGQIFRGIITFERSLDGVVWYPALATELNSMNQKTQVETAGIYSVRAEAQYLRYNVTNITGSFDMMIDGGQSPLSPVDKISWAMDPTNNTPLYTAPSPGTTKQDLSGALIPSDSGTVTPTPLIFIPVAIPTTIDTTGYQSISMTTGVGLVGTVSGSNDGITFQPMLGYSMLSGLSTSALAAVGNYIFPCLTRYIKITVTVAGSLTYYLRQQPFTNNLVNLQQIGGTTTSQATSQLGVNIVNVGGTGTVTGGLAGTLGVGGVNAVGVASVSNPVLIGGVDPTGLARRATTTMLGDLITSNRTIPTSNASITSTTTGSTPIGLSSFVNQLPINVQDTSEYEGQDQTEILAQILQEMKIMNQQLYELPKVLAGALQGSTVPTLGGNVQLGDEPAQMRNDSSLFINQQ